MSVRVVPLPHFEGEEARGVVGDFGPFGIEMIELQVLRERPHFLFWKRGKWVCIQSTFFDPQEAIAESIDLEAWTTARLDKLMQWERFDRAKAEARANFYREG